MSVCAGSFSSLFNLCILPYWISSVLSLRHATLKRFQLQLHLTE